MNPRENLSRSKEVLDAYFRQGLHELGAALYPGGTAAQHPEYGMIGTRTPGQVADGLRADNQTTPTKDNAEPSQLQTHLEQAQERESPEPDISPEPEIDRD
ncbi:MAG: hypothetical protein CMJ35_15440 [Phycisphaerae bacterium]|nr:hypothetical protein [Phycisphaerae bacterium]MBM92982.1 hypothetical protein [Phycisphaerae bacterium]|tara:strand:- start:188 stop:490 length:303 start_codon:yes stop_codon:yes gene_type:complete